HDPELLHPDAAAAFTQWLAGDLAPADVERIELWRSGRPWLAKVGRWDVVIGHGHRGDPDNDVDPEPVFAALRRGDATFPLPPGSQLVLGPLARFKRAMTPDGRRRFPFLDALKPELPSVLLLLLYLDAPLVVSSLPASFGTLARLFTRRVGRRLSTGPALGSRMRGDSASRFASERASDFAREWPSDGASVPTPDAALAGLRADGLAGTPVERLADRLASDLCDVLSDDERAAPELLLTRLDDWLAPGRESFDSNEPSLRSVSRSAQRSSEQTLADHDGLSAKFLRAWLRSEARRSPAFFDTSARGALDDRIIAEQLPPNCGPRVVIAGHTHAARDIRLDAERVYLNTGTWTELLDLADFADTDAGLKRLIDRLEAGELPARRRLHWGEVTKAGPRLHEFP
ncbi:MAG TPA: hypothetical protein PLV92_26480, partial [Pirellulaceae bacterium]|nr:hypothetical protein [Pirellulaceae bacterium]